MATHSSILAWRIPKDRGAWQATVCEVTRSQTRLSDQAQHLPQQGTERLGHRLLPDSQGVSAHTHTQNGVAFVVVAVLVAQSCSTLCDPTDCSPPRSSVRGILQLRILV